MSWVSLEPSHKVRVRKQHHCLWCGRTWPVGSTLWTWTGKWAVDHAVARTYMCQVCMTYMDEYWHWYVDNELPCEPFWVDDPEKYAEIEQRMSLVIVVMEANVDFVLPMQDMSDDRRRRLIRKGRVS